MLDFKDLMEVKEERQQLNEVEENHHNVILGEKSLSCSLTDNNNNQSQKKNQKRGKNVFICPQCAKSFTQKIGLELHMPIHASEKPFTCSKCEKSFWCKKNLMDLIRVHTRDKPFMCDQCGKRRNHTCVLCVDRVSHDWMVLKS
uniref:C2H2-type domain-containing protein n=1 Tax=Cyprinus carpio carpio TaxID=630221 RepID=A0A9J8D610_CYPCA